MCMLIARTCRRGRKTRFTFKEHPRLYLQVPLFRSDCAWQRSGKWLKTQNTPAARIGQVTIIYPEISLVTSPDECVWKLKVKTHTGGLTAQLKEKKKRREAGGAWECLKSPSSERQKTIRGVAFLLISEVWIFIRGWGVVIWFIWSSVSIWCHS